MLTGTRAQRTQGVPDSPGASRMQHLAGVGIFVLVLALYVTTMPHSFVPGDSARYLNMANTGILSDRGNGVPLYITLLNAITHLPLPFTVSDGLRCNFLTVLLAASGLTLFYRAALQLTGSIVAAVVAAIGLITSAMVWSNAAWLMPHISLVLVGAVFALLLIRYDQNPTKTRSAAVGLTCGVGFGLLPNALLFAPAALAYPLLRRQPSQARPEIAAAAAGISAGIALNILLIVAHELWNPRFAIDGRSVVDATIFFLRGGVETGWLLDNLSAVSALRGVFALPMEILADFEIFGSALTVFGLIVGLRARRSLHLALLVTLALLSMWSGVYPGDTRMLHGLAAYPIAGLWMAVAAQRILEQVPERFGRIAPPRLATFGPSGPRILCGVLLAFALLGNMAAGKLLYRESLCNSEEWFFAGFCRERVPARVGDRYLREAREAIERVPEGALLLGAAWDAADQMNYFIVVHAVRPDLVEALDLTKLGVEDFVDRVNPAWERGRPVYLFGDWQDVRAWSAELLAHFTGMPRGASLFELFPKDALPGDERKAAAAVAGTDS